MKKNPSIKELFDEDRFEVVKALDHAQIKEFVFDQISKGGKLTFWYMIYQLGMIILAVALFVYVIYKAFKGDSSLVLFSGLAILFSFTAMVVIHELLHGIALKLLGAPRVRYGGYLKKFIFYAEASGFVLNRKQFYFVALTPFIVVKFISLVGIVLFLHHPIWCFFFLLMSLHSLFCAGDIGLMSFFEQHKNSDVYTFDNHSEKRSYYFVSKNRASDKV